MRELNRVRLNGLRALEAVGRLGSLQAAADELGVSSGAVSQQIIKAEEELGRAVFQRTPKGLVQTEFGAALQPHLAEGFRSLLRGVRLATSSAGDILTVTTPPVLAAKWLVPRLTGYQQAHPQVRVRLEATIVNADLNGGDVDLAIRIGKPPWPDADAELLMHQEVFPVCTPELARRLVSSGDLKTVPVLIDANSRIGWDVWLAAAGRAGAQLTVGYSYEDSALCLEAAIAGQGMMLAWQTLAADALASGCLVAPFPERTRTGYSYWLLTGRHRKPSPHAAGFMAWLKTEMEKTARCFAAA